MSEDEDIKTAVDDGRETEEVARRSKGEFRSIKPSTYMVMEEGILSDLLRRLDTVRLSAKDLSNARLKVFKSAANTDLETANKYRKCILGSKRLTDEEFQKYITSKTHATIKDTYWLLIAEIDERLGEDINESVSGRASNSNSYEANTRLKSIDIPSFSGKYEEWTPFINLFNALVDKRENLEPVTKLHYFMDALTGEAYDQIKNLALTNANYSIARTILSEQYNHKRKIAQTYMRKLLDRKPINNETSKALRDFINSTKDCLSSLNGLELPTEQWDYILLFLLQTKIPQITLMKWEEELGSSRDIPKFETFLKFLETRFRTLEMLESPSNDHNSKKHSRSAANTSNAFHIQNNSKISCQLCQQSHFISNCKNFLDLNTAARYKLVIQNKLCINCLSPNHMLDRCTSKHHCKECPKRHHTLIHRDFNSDFNLNKANNSSHSQKHSNKSRNQKTKKRSSNTGQSTQVYTTQSQTLNPEMQLNAPINSNNSSTNSHEQNHNVSHHIRSVSKGIFLLGTAVVQVSNDRGNFRTVRVLLDTGSEDNYIIDSVVNGIPLKKYYSPSSISVIGGQTVEGITHRCDFTLKSLHNEFQLRVNAGIKSAITPDIPQEPIPGICYNFLNNLKLADPSFDEPGQIHVLLGMGVWVQVIQNGVIKGESLLAQKTTLGWLVQGVAEQSSSRYSTNSSRCHLTQTLEDQVQRFWELEKVGEGRVIESPDNTLCEEIVLNSIKRSEDGKLSVDLPFKDNILPTLGESKSIAKKRFFNLEKRLEQNSKLREEYHKTIQEYIDQGHMRLIEDSQLSDCGGKSYYVPHHAVFKESSSTTKVRVVFDASCKTTDSTSLNDHLLTGPKLQIDIRDILLRWRQYPFVLSADIEKMYRQFWVNEPFQNYQRVLWRFSKTEQLKSYVLTTVTFGTSAAPYLALRLLKYISESSAAEQFPLASQAIQSDFFVDDLLSGTYTHEDAITLHQEVRELLSQFGLSIRKWCGNDLSILTNIPSDLCEISHHTFDETDFKKTLGVYWSPSQDSFAFSVERQDFQTLKFTKRKTLSLIARLYDPLGWLGPCTMYAKILMQRIWQSSTGWDDEIPFDIQTQFKFFLEDLQNLNELCIPRWIHLRSATEAITLLGFADASELGFGCVVYLKNAESSNKHIMLTSRSRVAPVNFTTIARLELCAALLLAEVLEWCESLFPQRQITVHAFSDSKIVLSWLQSHPSRWKTFVANRTSAILERYDRSHWHYVNTKENPADFISRGLLPNEILNNNLWWEGPGTLELDQPFSLESEQEQKMIQNETKAKACLRIHNVNNSLIKYFSSNRRLFKRVTTICSFLIKCLLKCCKSHLEKQQQYLSRIEKLQNAEYVVLRLVQQEYFSKEIFALTNQKAIAKDSKIRTLCPFIDGFGILRVGSRLENSDTLTYNQKFPIILPSQHQVTTNVIDEAHSATMHGGYKLMLAYTRNKFHILRGKERIRLFLRRCVNCMRYAKVQQNQLMGSLPFPRVNQAKPFLFTGVDYAGPILIKNPFSKGSKTSKAYIAVFVCLCTKALHLELVSDLTSEAFLGSLRRFVYRRGRVQVMHSDCGSNFKGASKILLNECHEAQKSWKQDLQNHLESAGIEWEFNPPASPHFGGLWEAGVKSIKTHLNKTLKDAILTFEELYTVLIQIEGILNSRPLCPISDNPDSFEVLSPAHFLVGEPIVAPLEPKYEIKTVPLSHRKRWKYIQSLQQQFWIHWKETYLYSLSKRPKWLTLDRNFQVDDLVLVTEDNYAPTIWPRARIIETHPGHDGIVRVVTLKTSDGKTFKRPIAKLRFLPISTQEELPQQNVEDPP